MERVDIGCWVLLDSPFLLKTVNLRFFINLFLLSLIKLNCRQFTIQIYKETISIQIRPQMKENKVRTFQNYQKLLSDNKQSKIKNKNPFNDENEQKISKNISGNKKVNNNSQSQQKKAQKDSESPKKVLSPNRHRRCNQPPVQSVSYGQLQVILKNIDSIKIKAKQQIQQLELKNKFLLNDIDQLKKKLEQVHRLQEEIQIQRKQMQQNSQNIKANYQISLHEILLKQRIWMEEKKQYVQEIINYKENIRLHATQVEQLEDKLHAQTVSKRQRHAKYESLVNTLTSNKPERISQIVYQITQNYNNASILDIINSFEKQIIVFQKDRQQASMASQVSSQQISSQKQRNMKSQEHISKLMNQNEGLIQKISEKQEIHKIQVSRLSKLLDQQRDFNASAKNQVKNLESQNDEKAIQIQNLRRNISDLQEIIRHLKRQIDSMNVNLQTQKFNQRYFEIVDEECNQLEDLSNVLKKMEMFQKCKIQNRTNIQKIQFLCKMMDY